MGGMNEGLPLPIFSLPSTVAIVCWGWGAEAPPLVMADKLRYFLMRLLFLLIQVFPMFETLGSALLIRHFQSLSALQTDTILRCPWSDRSSAVGNNTKASVACTASLGESGKKSIGLEQGGPMITQRPTRCTGLATIACVLFLYVMTVSIAVLCVLYFVAQWARSSALFAR